LVGSQNWCENYGEEKSPCYCYQILYVDFAMKITGPAIRVHHWTRLWINLVRLALQKFRLVPVWIILV
jgi:hypothetical protein